jgi:hypothetical protein
VQGNALWLVTGPGRVTRYDLSTGTATEVELPRDVVSEAEVGGPPAPGATRIVADDDAVWVAYQLGVTGNPPVTAVVRLAPDGTVTARASLPPTAPGGGRLEPQSVAVGGGAVWIVGRAAVVALDAGSLAMRQGFAVQTETPVELHDAAFAAGMLWSYDATSSALLRIGEDGRVRARIPLTDGAPPPVPAPASIVGSRDALWVRVRTSASTLEQRVTRVDARSGDITGRFDAPAELEIGAIAVSRPLDRTT